MKKRIAVIIVISTSFTACKQANIDCIRPYTKKEQNFIHSLEKDSIEVELARFNYGYTGDSIEICQRYLTDSYVIRIKNIAFNLVKNTDSMRLKTRQIASDLYTKVINDEILLNTSEIVVKVSTKAEEKKLNPKNKGSWTLVSETFYQATFKKKDLENYCGFKIKEHNNLSIRENIRKDSDTLLIFSEIN